MLGGEGGQARERLDLGHGLDPAAHERARAVRASASNAAAQNTSQSRNTLTMTAAMPAWRTSAKPRRLWSRPSLARGAWPRRDRLAGRARRGALEALGLDAPEEHEVAAEGRLGGRGGREDRLERGARARRARRAARPAGPARVRSTTRLRPRICEAANMPMVTPTSTRPSTRS